MAEWYQRYRIVCLSVSQADIFYVRFDWIECSAYDPLKCQELANRHNITSQKILIFKYVVSYTHMEVIRLCSYCASRSELHHLM